MKGSRNIFSFIFILAVTILLLRPIIIFSSADFQAILSTCDARASGLQKIVKKRSETFRIGNIISKENEEKTSKNSFLFYYLYANKEWLRFLLFALSSLLSLYIYFLRKRSKLFEITPDSEQYLAISVIRI